MSAATQVKYDPTQFFKKLCAIPENLKTKSHKIWDQSVEPFKNGGHFKLPRINLGLIRLKHDRLTLLVNLKL